MLHISDTGHNITNLSAFQYSSQCYAYIIFHNLNYDLYKYESSWPGGLGKLARQNSRQILPYPGRNYHVNSPANLARRNVSHSNV